MNLSLILPIYNAQEFIHDSLEKLVELLEKTEVPEIQVILVNDGSEDNTLERINNFLQSYNGRIKFDLISYEKNRNIGFAIRQGIEKVKNEVVMIMDCDLPFKLDIVTQSLILIRSCDMVTVDRTKKKESYNVGFLRFLLHRGLIFIIKIIFGKYLRGIDDFVAGFKVIKKDLLDKIKHNLCSNTSLIHFEIILLTQLLNLKGANYKICFVYPYLNVDTNKFSTYSFAKIIKTVMKILLELIVIKINLRKIINERI
ncbi:MAG: glycosyltransferase family 2 protein [Candidatus Calescibacterium sp.]|nr:glycosyltransferase family 2 protein [Candidatus Calescibacterium sp.]MCX7972153.1 glycosyltransferase family 2 protein [bacterium]MDW8194842.1 glycosyltransferase family 2 protein [Candidatus Calescibacterium sp.]